MRNRDFSAVTLGVLDTVASVWAEPHCLSAGAGVVGLAVAPAMLHHATARGEVFAGRVASALGDMRECEPAMGHDGSFGDVLHAVRTAKGWTQAEAGRRIGVARNTISRWELGQTTPTGIQRARTLEVFGLV